MKTRKGWAAGVAVIVASLLTGVSAGLVAADYPTRYMDVVIPYSPGSTDLTLRLYKDKVEKLFESFEKAGELIAFIVRQGEIPPKVIAVAGLAGLRRAQLPGYPQDGQFPQIIGQDTAETQVRSQFADAPGELRMMEQAAIHPVNPAPPGRQLVIKYLRSARKRRIHDPAPFHRWKVLFRPK